MKKIMKKLKLEDKNNLIIVFKDKNTWKKSLYSQMCFNYYLIYCFKKK